MSFEANQKELSKLVNDAVYDIPRNQRKYVWNKENWTDLLNDVIYAVENETTHFIGSVVLKVESKKGGLEHYTVIDGQQQLITSTLLLSAIMYQLKQISMNDHAQGMLKFFKATDNKSQDVNIISTECHPTLTLLVDKVSKTSSSEIKNVSINSFSDTCVVNSKQDNIIIDCFKHFVKMIEVQCANHSDNLLKLQQGVLSIAYVHIEAHTDEDSYTIFEILNARGQTLEDYELLKNYIMRYILPRESVDDAKRSWAEIENMIGSDMKSFIKHYAGHKFESTDDLRKESYKLIQKKTKGQDEIVNNSFSEFPKLPRA